MNLLDVMIGTAAETGAVTIVTDYGGEPCLAAIGSAPALILWWGELPTEVRDRLADVSVHVAKPWREKPWSVWRWPEVTP